MAESLASHAIQNVAILQSRLIRSAQSQTKSLPVSSASFRATQIEAIHSLPAPSRPIIQIKSKAMRGFGSKRIEKPQKWVSRWAKARKPCENSGWRSPPSSLPNFLKICPHVLLRVYRFSRCSINRCSRAQDATAASRNTSSAIEPFLPVISAPRSRELNVATTESLSASVEIMASTLARSISSISTSQWTSPG